MNVEQARELIEKATPGPWKRDGPWWYDDYRCCTCLTHGDAREIVTALPECTPADIEFIAAARTGWPEALDALEQARAELDYLERFGTMRSYRDRAEAAEREASELRDENLFLKRQDHSQTQELVQLRERNEKLTEALRHLENVTAAYLNLPGDGADLDEAIELRAEMETATAEARAALSTGEDTE